MKILEYANHIRKSSHIQHTVSNYAENEWHNVSEDFFLDLTNRSAFATRIRPIHNGNGYQGNVYQFLWRANMDYYNLLPIETQTSEPQPMQQPATTDYAAQLSAVKTLPELFDFRAKLKGFWKAEIEDYFGDMNCKITEPERLQAERISELEFFITRAESQIKALENSGVFLAAVDGRGIVGTLDLTLEKSEAVEKTTWSVSGSGLSPIEEKANNRGLLEKLRELQSLVKECQWAYADRDFSVLYDWGLVVKLSICDSGEYAYLWRKEMDYENFFQIKNPPKN